MYIICVRMFKKISFFSILSKPPLFQIEKS